MDHVAIHIKIVPMGYTVVVLSKCLLKTSYRYQVVALGKERPVLFYAAA
jgi:hypothetical protein